MCNVLLEHQKCLLFVDLFILGTDSYSEFKPMLIPYNFYFLGHLKCVCWEDSINTLRFRIDGPIFRVKM